jgi:2-polyprenyl-3-methyl-5-hydroxy-6-metoxy-1,4-benzoquinol methylase
MTRPSGTGDPGREQATYRERIYECYASRFQDASRTFDPESARVWGRPFSRHLRGWLPDDRSAPILELACGGGRFLHFLRSKGYSSVQGIDISPEQVALSRQVMDADRVHEGDAISFLERHPASFSLIVALDLVEHLDKQECMQFLDVCLAALAPGGRLVLQTPNLENSEQIAGGGTRLME